MSEVSKQRPGDHVEDGAVYVSGPFFTGGRMGGPGGDVGVVCRRCGFETYFAARLGEEPPDRCPKCSAAT